MANTPFDTIEGAQDYLRLLGSELEVVRTDIQEDIEEAAQDRAARRIDALHIVDYKLKQLAQHVGASRRILNDLRMLRRLLDADRDVVATVSQQPEEAGPARS
jgi:hypothetical protein